MQSHPLPESAACTAFLSSKGNALAAVDATLAMTSGEKVLCRADLGRDDLTGLSLGQYDLGLRLGAGGMGLVYQAKHRHLGKSFAIKFIRNEVNGEEATSRFLQEIRTLGTLQHSNLINAVDAGVEQRMPYCVTELLDGHDLGTWVELRGPLPFGVAAEVIRQAAEGLCCAHARNIVHRDIKPSNLFLQFDGTVKLLDFGLSLSEGSQTRATEPGRVLGTVDFMSPEQVRDAHQVTTASDLYSLGASLFYLLTGRLLYDDQQYPSTINKLHAIGQPTDHLLFEARCTLPDAAKQLLSQLLEPNPNDRLSSAEHLATQLHPWASSHALAAWLGGKPQSEPASAPENVSRRLTKPLYLAAGITVSAAIVLIGLGIHGAAKLPNPESGPPATSAALGTSPTTPMAFADRSPAAVPAIPEPSEVSAKPTIDVPDLSQPARQTVSGAGRTALSAGAIDFSAASSMKRSARGRISTQSHSTQISTP